jgi:hypothetical protein
VSAVHRADPVRPLRPLPVRVVQNPSADFTELDGLESELGPDFTMTLTLWEDDGIVLHMHGDRLPLLRSEYTVKLTVKPSDVRAEAASLSALWDRLLVHHTPLDADLNPAPGRRSDPYASLVNLRDEPPEELLRILGELADAGEDLLFGTLLGGEGKQVGYFRDFLARALGATGLRVRFNSELFLPWPMLCLPEAGEAREPREGPGDRETSDGQETATQAVFDALFSRFLGYRHQIDQTGGTHPLRRRRTTPPHRPTVSLNHDITLDRLGRTRAAEVSELLRRGTSFTERTLRDELLDALGRSDFDEQFMYFFCHGHYLDRGPQPACLALELSDRRPIDAQTVGRRRSPFGELSPFRPFVLLNACNANGPSGTHDRADLGRALIRAGARGVLGPQIEMPQAFGAEYALAFVRDYLTGAHTAGETVHRLARHFADVHRNPLGLAYSLHCGMDSRLQRAPAKAADQGQEVTV